MQAIDPAHDIAIDHHIRAFLKTLNSAGGMPLEELTPAEARAVLTSLQGSVQLDLPPANVSDLTNMPDEQHDPRLGAAESLLPNSHSASFAAASRGRTEATIAIGY